MKLPAIEQIKRVEDMRLSAVYFLCANGEVLYVGRTVNLSQRLDTHRRNIQHTEAFYLPCSKAELSGLERKYIKELNPPLNKACRLKKAPEEDTRLAVLAERMNELYLIHRAGLASLEAAKQAFLTEEAKHNATFRDYWKVRDQWKALKLEMKQARKRARLVLRAKRKRTEERRRAKMIQRRLDRAA